MGTVLGEAMELEDPENNEIVTWNFWDNVFYIINVRLVFYICIVKEKQLQISFCSLHVFRDQSL